MGKIIAMVVFVSLFGIAAFCLFFIIKISKGLNDGKMQIQDGRWKLAKFDNWFVRIFAGRRLKKEKQRLFDGEKKYARYWKIRLACVLICVGCVIGAVVCVALCFYW